MKIAFLGNINNHPFHVAHYFKELGHNVRVYIDAAPNIALHRPESLTYGIQYPYPDWIIEEPRLEKSLWMHFPWIFARKVINYINTCDAVVVNHYGHRFLPYIKKEVIKICMFTGGDLETAADYNSVLEMRLSSPKLKLFPSFLKKWYAEFSVNQLRNGIQKADLISYFPEGLVAKGDELLHEIFKDKKYNKYSHYAMFLDGLVYTAPKDNEPLKVLNLARFTWKKPFPPGVHEQENKGNDIMIKGIAEYLQQHGNKLNINFIEKGINVPETKELIEQFGFSNMVTWHKEMPMNELIEFIKDADIVFDQLGRHLPGVGIFGMALGRPLIANMRKDVIEKHTNEPLPMCNATNSHEVAEWLHKLESNKSLRHQVGSISSTYAKKHFDIRSEAKYFLDFILAKTEKTDA